MDYPETFERLWRIYPKRDRNNPKKLAFLQWKRRIKEGAAHEALESAVRVYYGYCHRKGIIGTDKVMMAATFLGPNERWQPFAEGGGSSEPRKQSGAVQGLSGCAQQRGEVGKPPEQRVQVEEVHKSVREILRGLAEHKRMPGINYERSDK